MGENNECVQSTHGTEVRFRLGFIPCVHQHSEHAHWHTLVPTRRPTVYPAVTLLSPSLHCVPVRPPLSCRQLLPWTLGGGILVPMDVATKLVQSVLDSMTRLSTYKVPAGLLLQNGQFGNATDTIKSILSG